MSELPPRPAPPRSLRQRGADWVEWFGAARLVLSVVAVVVVVGGGAWLLRTPPAPTEAMLPFATTTTAIPEPTASAHPGADVVSTTVVPGSASAVVHVAGAVVEAGVHEVPAGSRVIEAIGAAGGPLPDADLDRLNLAAPVVDGQRVYVPVVGGTVPPEPAAAAPPATSAAPLGPVDLNHASTQELDSLPGIGPATAAAIVEHRARNGPFASVDDLEHVPGIGPAKLEAIRALVTV